MRETHPWLGGITDVAHGGAAHGLLDLSASIAPLGPSPAALAAARRVRLDAYPSPDAAPLAAAAAGELGLDPERIVCGAGAADLLLRAALAHLRPGDAAVVVAPCFGEYARAITACGAVPVHWTASPEGGFAVDTTAVAEAARKTGAAAGVLSRPANPTGVDVPLRQLKTLVEATPATTWIIDEAFVGLADDPSSAAGGDAVVVRSLTKELAIPGLRVGIADAPLPTARAMRALAPPWCVSAPAIAAAVAGLADRQWRRRTRESVRQGRSDLSLGLRQMGMQLTDAVANFVCALPPCPASVLAESMAAKGIAIRVCDDLGLPGWVRIGVPPPDRIGAVLAAAGAALVVGARG
jgi:histidinol-phosphate/aromatic aminotransferase/cobyric acid decarboxylase-like protein